MSAHGVEIGLLILRVVTGLVWCGHGTQKLFGWFGAKRRGTLEGEFSHFGYHPPLLFGYLAGTTETDRRAAARDAASRRRSAPGCSPASRSRRPSR